MQKLTYVDLTCIESSKEQTVFGKGSQKIVFTNFDTGKVLPLIKADVQVISDSKGNYEFTGFYLDKYGILELEFQSEETTCSIVSHIDSYTKEDMEQFKQGNNFSIEVHYLN